MKKCDRGGCVKWLLADDITATEGDPIANPAGSENWDPPACYKVFGTLRHRFASPTIMPFI